MDDTRRIATVHNWTTDTLEREINSQGELNTNKIRYQYGNHINSASLELSSTGAIISYEEYFPYGDTSLIAGTSQKEVKIKEYRYTGKEKDDATGLYYYGARYYASWLGRWMSADPLFRENPAVYERPKGSTAEEQEKLNTEYMQKLYHEGLNMYGYVKGNPVRFSDPTGRNKVKDVWNYFKTHHSERKGAWAVADWAHQALGSGSSYIKENKTPENINNNLFKDGIGSPLKGYSLNDITKSHDKGGAIWSPFGPRKHPVTKEPDRHAGIDIGALNGTAITAIAAGKINFKYTEGYGYQAMINHGNGLESFYAHMSEESYNTFKSLYSGDKAYVKKGQKIGEIGMSGASTGGHLHFAIRSLQKDALKIEKLKRDTDKNDNIYYNFNPIKVFELFYKK